ncbi:MAG TPA: ACT domain-containing protein, partial [Thermoguttaceae bacterium]|nr:ACT domain-containing protein [Thermoguttaceae bacterium]
EKLSPVQPSAHTSKAKAAVNYAARMAGMEDLIITGVDLDDAQARITLVNVPDRPGVAARIFEQIAQAGGVVDMIVQSVGRENKANVSFTIPQQDLDRCLRAAEATAKSLGCPAPKSSPKVAKLSVSGVGMRTHTLLVRRMFQCLADAKINVDMISTSEVRFHVVVDAAHGRKALDALKKEFADALV